MSAPPADADDILDWLRAYGQYDMNIGEAYAGYQTDPATPMRVLMAAECWYERRARPLDGWPVADDDTALQVLAIAKEAVRREDERLRSLWMKP